MRRPTQAWPIASRDLVHITLSHQLMGVVWPRSGHCKRSSWIPAWEKRMHLWPGSTRGTTMISAEREFERSLELNPRYATAHQFFGFYLGLMGRYEEGYTEIKRAIRLDPLSSVFEWSLGF